MNKGTREGASLGDVPHEECVSEQPGVWDVAVLPRAEGEVGSGAVPPVWMLP